MSTLLASEALSSVRQLPVSEAATRADFSQIRYAQCWEDADILLKALEVQPGDICLSIGSAGDNALSLLARRPERVIAVDLNPSQLACLELRVAAYHRLDHAGLLELMQGRYKSSMSITVKNIWRMIMKRGNRKGDHC